MSTFTTQLLIVGGSVAATRAAEAAARRAPDLTITLVSDEAHPPYERPPLSKTDLTEALDLDQLTYPSVSALREHGVEFCLGTRARSLDLASRSVTTSTGVVTYEALVIATGCEPLVPPLLRGLDDVHVLRSFADARALRVAMSDPSRSVAIIGAGFIGGEFAATVVKSGRPVAMIDLAPLPLSRFGRDVGDSYRRLHLEAGVVLHLGRGVVGVEGDARGRRLVLDDGTRVPADVVLVGVGVRPATGWLQGAGLDIGDGLVCDSTLRAADGVYAAGDIVRWPNHRWGSEMRVEHWTNAAEQGRLAGLNAVAELSGDRGDDCATVPYFWSDQHGTRLQFAGVRADGDQVDLSQREDGSLRLYHHAGVVSGVLAFGRRAEFVKLRAALRKPLTLEDAVRLVG